MTTSSSAPQARASTRVSIAWDGADPYEDTDTVVLTFPGHSLDLRVFKDSGGQTIDWSTVAFVQTVQGSDPGMWLLVELLAMSITSLMIN